MEVYQCGMTQPAPVDPSAALTPEQEAAYAQHMQAFEEKCARVTIAIGTTLQSVLQGGDMDVAATALIRYAGGFASQVPHFNEEILVHELVTAFDKTREFMTNPPQELRDALGLKAGEALPADFQERLTKLAQERGLVPPQAAAGG